MGMLSISKYLYVESLLQNSQFASPRCPESTNKSCVQLSELTNPAPSTKQFTPIYEGIYTIYVSPTDGIDSSSRDATNIHTPFKSLSFAFNHIRSQSFGSNEWKQILLREGTYYLKDTLYFNADDSNLIIKSYNGENTIISGAVPLADLKWTIYKKMKNNLNIFRTPIDLTKNNISLDGIPGLRVNGSRAIRARYPNANPEYGFGSKLKAQKWIPPTNVKPEVVIYPDEPFRNITYEQYWQHYDLGIGGVCDNFVPPAGFWCSTNVGTYRVPTGMIYSNGSLPNAPYKDASGGIVQVFEMIILFNVRLMYLHIYTYRHGGLDIGAAGCLRLVNTNLVRGKYTLIKVDFKEHVVVIVVMNIMLKMYLKN